MISRLSKIDLHRIYCLLLVQGTFEERVEFFTQSGSIYSVNSKPSKSFFNYRLNFCEFLLKMGKSRASAARKRKRGKSSGLVAARAETGKFFSPELCEKLNFCSFPCAQPLKTTCIITFCLVWWFDAYSNHPCPLHDVSDSLRRFFLISTLNGEVAWPSVDMPTFFLSDWSTRQAWSPCSGKQRLVFTSG